MFSLSEKYHSELKESFNSNYLSGDTYLFKIKDIGNQDKVWKKAIVEITALKKNNEFIKCREDVVFFIQTENKLEIGDIIATNCKLETVKNKGNPGEFNAEYYWSSRGIDKLGFISDQGFKLLDNQIEWFTKWTLKSRNFLINILKSNLKGEELAVAQALILGERSLLENETINAFGNSGAMHVLAVSGLHIGIFLQIILIFLKFFSKYISKRNALIIALVIIWIYTILSGLSASVLRSTVMFTVLTISQLFGKNHHSINSLFFTGFILLILNPLNLFDIGFQLSFLAMLGIFWFYQSISKALYFKIKWMQKIWETTAVGLAAQSLTVPLTLYYFHQFPNYFIITNIALMSVTGIILGFGLLVFAFSWVKWLGKTVVFILSLSLIFTIKTVHFIDELPGSTANGFVISEISVLICFLLVIGFFLLKEKSYRIGLTLISIIMIFSIEMDRFNRMNAKEICFFNHSKVTFIVKNKSKSYCFYDATNNDRFDKIERLVSDYSKIYPSTIRYFKIGEKDWVLKDKGLDIKVEKQKGSYLIIVNNKRYQFETNNEIFKSPCSIKRILMPWIEKSNKTDYSLKEQAFQFEIL